MISTKRYKHLLCINCKIPIHISEVFGTCLPTFIAFKSFSIFIISKLKKGIMIHRSASAWNIKYMHINFNLQTLNIHCRLHRRYNMMAHIKDPIRDAQELTVMQQINQSSQSNFRSSTGFINLEQKWMTGSIHSCIQ